MLRVIIEQETAHFRIPTIGNPYMTYLLPPPSTIYGFLRKITNYKSINYKNTLLSIQGKHEGFSMEKERLILETKKEIKTNIIPIQKMHNAKWIIHVNSPGYEQDIMNALSSNTCVLRLGRTEDLIIDVEVREITETQKSGNENDDCFIYTKWEKGKDFKGQLFSMFLDSEVNDDLKIIGYKPIQLIYSSVYSIKKQLEKSDGEYLISWIT